MSTSPWDILSARLTRVTDAIKNLPRLRQATLYSASPLQVVFDTDTEPTLAYATLVSGLTPGERVLVANVGHYYWIVGVKGGPHDLDVGGQIYQNGNKVIDETMPAFLTRQANGDRAYFGTGPQGSVPGDQQYIVMSPPRQTDTSWALVVRDHLIEQLRIYKDGHMESPHAPYAMAAGSVTVPGGSGAVTSATVTLPAGRFTQTPLITLTASSGVPQRLLGPSHSDRSTSSFTVYLVRDNTGDTGVHWNAVQMTPSNASG